MRQLLPVAAILVVIASSRADEKINAPVPKAPVPPSIHGNYYLLATSNGVEFTPKGAFNSVGPGGGNRISPLRTQGGTATITRSEIVIEGRTVAAAPTTMEYTLDPTKSPITIDVETTTIRGKKVKSLGIVEISGNRLTIAIAKEGGRAAQDDG